MAYENIIYRKGNGVATIVFNRPQVLNALTPAFLVEVKAALDEAERDREVGVVVLTGSGRAFSAGVDLAVLKGLGLEHGAVGSVLDDPGRALIKAIQTIPKVVIAMVNGYCFTGALEIVLGCDLVVASEKAVFGDTHARWGIRPSWGMSQRLPRTIGILKARELSFTADTVTADEAERIGLVNKVALADKLEETVMEMAKKILANSPETIAAYKHLYNHGYSETLEKGLELEVNTQFTIRDTRERLEQFGKRG